MPKYTLATVVQKAIAPALCDRKEMLDADPGRAGETRAEIAAIESLRGVKLITVLYSHAAMMALTFAEQWEHGFAEANHFKGKYGRKAAQLSILFQNYRHRHFGRNAYEDAFARAETYTLGPDRQFRNKDGKLMPTRDFPE